MNDIKQLYDNIVPNGSDEEFIHAVKVKAERPRRKRASGIALAAAAALTLTLSAGAAAGWDYTAVFNSFFRNNDAIITALETQPEYKVLQNTFENLDFKLTGLYVDSGTLFMTVEIESDYDLFVNDEAVFYGHDYRRGPDYLMFVGNDENTRINAGGAYRTVFIDEKNITMLCEFYAGDSTDFNGRELIFNMDGFCGTDHGGSQSKDLFLLEGLATLKFTVPENTENRQIHFFPDATLKDSDITVNEIYISPYLMRVNYVYPTIFNDDGNYKTDRENIDIKLKTKDGGIIDMTFPEWMGNTGTGVNDETTTISITIMRSKILDTDSIASVIIDGTEIKIE